ncbi:small conductance calcium-activated potassium channel protein 2-like [Mercenaria mercenaria]|uniref:small conductance calcium-activated potassium channel protein 2-like n=1 Tax=Mercenaria mercenaria TaxID=6596 RepID=UPI00234F4B05|nr:small conductance calcium-activated potassium channel protein 2-like [Mercenaria mercenaria]
MSTIIENPEIPLVGMNGRNKLYSDDFTSPQNGDIVGNSRPFRFETVGKMLAKRKELFQKRKRHCDVSLCLAVLGVAFMIVETELTSAFIIGRNTIVSYLLKMCITALTVALLIFIGLYHYNDIQIFAVGNGVDDLRLAMSARRIIKIIAEFIVCSIHPIPGAFTITWEATVADGQNARKMTVPLDVILSLPMFLRFYLICRAIMLHSRLYQDASSQGLGALNRIHFNFRFIFKSLMTLYPEYVLTIIMFASFLTSSWALRLCEMYGEDGYKDDVHASFLNCMWLIAVTFLSVGYGDIVPTSYCGRGIAVLTGMMGAGCTALVVAVLARRLELSRSEKYVHDFVIDADLDKRLKHNAANVMRAGWFVYKYKKSKERSSKIVSHHRKLLRAVYNIREIRAAQRRLMDNSVTLVEVGKSQNEITSAIYVMKCRQTLLEEKMVSVEGKLSLILDQVVAIKRALYRAKDE